MFDFFGTVINYIETFFRYLGTIISNIIAALAYLVTSQQAITVIMGYAYRDWWSLSRFYSNSCYALFAYEIEVIKSMGEVGTYIDLFMLVVNGLIGFISSMTFSVYGIQVNYGAIVFATIVIGFVVSVYWKGARS